MSAYLFGSGTLIGKRTDQANPTPSLFGILQEVEVSFDRTLKELMGQYNMAVAVAGAGLKVTGKAKYGRFQMGQMNDMFFGQSAPATGTTEMAEAEARTTTANTFTVTNSATFVEDMGVFLASTGVQWTRVASAPAAGQYTVAAGVYTFNATDNAKNFIVYYTYTVAATGFTATFAQQLQGSVPSFALSLKERFSQNGVNSTLNLKLNSVVAGKLSMPFKNMDFGIPDIEFQAFADASGNWGTLSLTE